MQEPDIEVDDDPARLDRDVIWEFLSTEAYWGRSRDRATIERLIDDAWRVVGVYWRDTGAMIGFARATSDGWSQAYLADVFVVPEARGHGVGKALVRAMVVDGPGHDLRWSLHTRDAHGLYRQFGFDDPPANYMERPPSN